MNSKVVTAIVLAVVVLAGFGAVALMKGEKNVASDQMTDHSSSKDQQSDQNSSESKETNQVVYKDFEVAPSSIKVKKGTTVTWTNQDSAKHDVTPDKESEDFKASELFGKGETHSVTFNTVGTYTYYCSPHPYMKGTVEVVE